MPSPNDLVFSAATDVGRKREHNEDNFLVDHALGLFVVADGMGGHAAGEVASAIAVRTVHEVLAGHRTVLLERALAGTSDNEGGIQHVLTLLEHAVNTASDRVHTEGLADTAKRGMGTTISVLLVLGSHAFVAHVGDSRIYMLRAGAVSQVTEDHTLARELVRMGMVNPEQLANIPRKNAITRAVGVYAHVEVDTMSFEVLPNDQFLLCSDGLSGYLDDSARPIAPFLEVADGDAVVRELIAFANSCGGKDNITAVIVRVPAGDVSGGLRAKRAALKREVLAAIPLFSRLNERQLMSMIAATELQCVAAGEVVMREGDAGDAMFVILEGRLRVEKGGAELRELSVGDQLGEMALIRVSPRSATVTAIVPSELICLRRGDFFDILRGDPQAAVKLLWQFINVLADRLEQTSEDLSLVRREFAADVVRVRSDRAPSERSQSDDPFAASSQELLAARSLGSPYLSANRGATLAEDGRRTTDVSAAVTLTGHPRAALATSSVDGPPLPPPSDALITPSPPVFSPAPPREEDLYKTNPNSPQANRRDSAAARGIGERQRLVTMEAMGASEAPSTSRSAPGVAVEEARPDSRPPSEVAAQTKPFKPSKQTVRLDDAAEAIGSLTEMRRQFRERIAAERGEKDKGKGGA